MKRSVTLRLDDARHYLEVLEKRKNECVACVENAPAQLEHACMDVDLLREIEETKKEISEFEESEHKLCSGCVEEKLNQLAHDEDCVTLAKALPSSEEVVKGVVEEVVEGVVEEVVNVVGPSVAEDLAREFKESASPVYEII